MKILSSVRMAMSGTSAAFTKRNADMMGVGRWLSVLPSLLTLRSASKSISIESRPNIPKMLNSQ